MTTSPSPSGFVAPGQETTVALGGITARLSDHSHALVPAPTLLATIEHVLSEAGIRLFVGAAHEKNEISTDSVWLGVVLDPETIGVTIIDAKSEQDWADNMGPGPDMALHRTTVVSQQVRSFLTGSMSLSDLLSTRYVENPLDAAIRSMFLAAWWHTRLAEGQSADAARFLLSLTAHPTLSAVLTFDADGVPGCPIPTQS